ncbi:hypothetical protein ACET3Z_019249 [Daucus carota]
MTKNFCRWDILTGDLELVGSLNGHYDTVYDIEIRSTLWSSVEIHQLICNPTFSSQHCLIHSPEEFLRSDFNFFITDLIITYKSNSSIVPWTRKAVSAYLWDLILLQRVMVNIPSCCHSIRGIYDLAGSSRQRYVLSIIWNFLFRATYLWLCWLPDIHSLA